MRKALFWFGWAVLFALPIAYGIEIFRFQDLPPVAAWKWLVPLAAVVLIFFSRDRDDVLRHHLVR